MEINLIDFGEYQAIGFDVVLIDDEYNLHFALFQLNEDGVPDECLLYRTTVFVKSLYQAAEKIKIFLGIGMFDNLQPLSSGHVLDENFEPIQKIDWNDFLSSIDVSSGNFTVEPQTFLH